MASMDATVMLYTQPGSEEPNLGITNPTNEELEITNRLSFVEWGDALTLPQFLEESDFLTRVPLARDGGMMSWILIESNKLPNQRPILASCETFRKRAFVTDQKGEISENIIYGVASVFVNPKNRDHGYGRRLMLELTRTLPDLHVGTSRSTGSVLYSDIGKLYYAKLGWLAPEVNFHLEFDPTSVNSSSDTHPVQEEDLPGLCQEDETLVRASMATLRSGKIKFMIVPDCDHMQWHLSKETFACQKIFGEVPRIKGALFGDRGNRVWAIWVHRYYSYPTDDATDNVLYILRFVVENLDPGPDQLRSQIEAVRAVLERAQVEAERWKLQSVKLWHPSPFLQNLVDKSGLPHRRVDRENEGIASLRWFGESNPNEVEWIACEKYAWV